MIPRGLLGGNGFKRAHPEASSAADVKDDLIIRLGAGPAGVVGDARNVRMREM